MFPIQFHRTINFLDKTNKLWINLFFIFLIALGLNIFKDYGISFDEPVSRENGAISLNHIFKKFDISVFNHDQEIKKFQTDLNTYRDRDYGVAFDLSVFALERLLQIDDSRQQYLFKHALTYLMFLAGVFAVYRLATRRFDDWKIGLITATMFVLSPRMFAESFYNGKDIVLMAISAIALNTAIGFILNPTIKRAIFHGVASGIAIDIRIVAVIIPVMTITIAMIEISQAKIHWQKIITLSAFYVFVTSVIVIIFWPWLWSDPIGNFLTAFRNMSKFRWDNFNLYFGEFVPAIKLPWHYPIVWIFITTPVLYSLFFIAGIWEGLSERFKQRQVLWKNEKQLQDLFLIGFFSGPLLAIIYFKSVLYDGWRQLYFIYPAFLLIASKGLVMLWKTDKDLHFKKVFITTLLSGQFISIAIWMWHVHPYQNLYFNYFVSTNKSELFEKDYWGLTNLQGLNYIVAHDKSSLIRVAPLGATSLTQSTMMLSPEERHRIKVVHALEDGDYIMTNYRFFNDSNVDMHQVNLPIFYQIKVDNKNILTIYRKKK